MFTELYAVFSEDVQFGSLFESRAAAEDHAMYLRNLGYRGQLVVEEVTEVEVFGDCRLAREGAE
jgi:hypothetical protein